ncbi:MAG: VOC family protein [Eubacteriales bacterium]|nr:VOC family protein [Eubacteriales bacterium]
MITGQVHAGITVGDLDRSVAFYRDILGLRHVKTEPPRASRGERLGVPGARIKIAIMDYPGGSIELIQYFEPKSQKEKAEPVNSIGQVHIAFQVDDIEKTIEKMVEKGVEFIGGNKHEVISDGPLQGWKWIYFKDPDGTNLELIEGKLSED